MFSRIIKRAAGLCSLLIVLSAIALAQTTHIEGTIRVKGEDGIGKPVPNAVVDIYRTDIKGHWQVKTDKQGVYRRLGMPITGTYMVVASGPGLTPTWVHNIRLAQVNTVDLLVNPGDGSTLTLEQVQAQIAQSKAGGGAAATVSAADRAKAEAAKKDYEARAAENKALQANFDQARAHYNTGIDMMKANNYQAALAEFQQAATVDTSKHAAFVELAYKSNANLAEAHYQIGVDLFNKKSKPEAKPHFEKAVEAVTKAINAVPASTTGATNPELIVYYNILAKNAALLVEHYGSVQSINEWAAMIDKAIAIDPQNKGKWEVAKANLYRFSGDTDKAITGYKAVLTAEPANLDALYNLGLTLIAASDKPTIQEGANALGEFVKNAPPADARVAAVKEALEAVKSAYNIEAEKPARRRRP